MTLPDETNSTPLQRNRELLHAVNSTATILLASDEGNDFHETLQKGLEYMGSCVDVDFIEIWQNEKIEDGYHAVLRHRWQSPYVLEEKQRIDINIFPYNDTDGWYEKFLAGECIEGPVAELSCEDQEFLSPFDIKSTLIIPLFVQNEFWGISCIDDCRMERRFTVEELDILRSGSLMIVNAINRNAERAELRNAITEHKKIMKEAERRDNLLYVVNSVASMMFTTEAYDDFDSSLYGCMDLMSRCVDVDRLQIWQNKMIEGELYFSLKYQWLSDFAKEINSPIVNSEFPYSSTPDWEKKFSASEYINGSFSSLLAEEKELLSPFGIKYIFLIPLFVHEEFWGFFSLEDCRGVRRFEGEELDILRSGALMMANALNRYQMLEEIERQDLLLKDALREAREANNAKSAFLARMSHEMRTPLNAIIGFSELSLMDATINRTMNHSLDISESEIFNNFEKINNAGMTLLATVNDILDISKIEAGKLELSLSEYDTPSLINDAITQSIMRINDKDIKFIANIDENLPYRLFGDDLRIKQILNNLLSNAFKYTAQGFVELDIKNVGNNDEKSVLLLISVKDTGMGIRAEDIDDLFSDYAMMDKSINRKIEGTGLGLPITKKIVEMMGGRISVESEYGKGSIFSVEIPQTIVDDSVIGKEISDNLGSFKYNDERRRLRGNMERIDLGGKRILVVDDVDVNLEVARGLLKPYGMIVDCLNNGIKAIEAIKSENIKYDAVFMDHMMPEMDGIETVRMIRNEIPTEYAKNIPIIALTANAITGNEDMFLENGFQAFLSKPIESVRLDEIIRKWIAPAGELIVSGSMPGITEDEVPGLNIKRALKRFSNNEDTYMDILTTYIGSTRELLNTIREVFTANGTFASNEKKEKYIIAVHGLKGSSRGIYADKIGDLAEALENSAREGNIEYVLKHNQNLLETTEELLHRIEVHIAVKKTKSGKEKKEFPDKGLLRKLYGFLDEYDMDGVDSIMEEIVKFDYESGDDLIIWIRNNIEKMNFTEILDRLSEII